MENSDVIMLLGEIQKVAVISTQTQTSVNLLRTEVSEMKKDTASCADVERVEEKICNHIENHKENRGLTPVWLGLLTTAAMSVIGFFLKR